MYRFCAKHKLKTVWATHLVGKPTDGVLAWAAHGTDTPENSRGGQEEGEEPLRSGKLAELALTAHAAFS